MTDADLIIIGAGPAGMAAAISASEAGAKVILLDEQQSAGGQIYRNVGSNHDGRSFLGEEYFEGLKLVEALSRSNVKCEFGTTVWRIEDDLRVVWSRDGVSNISSARHVLLATGAQERPAPFPGWELPGVMTAGAAQILMKSSRLLAKDAVLAGSGPLLYLVAVQLIKAGTPPIAIVETQTMKNAFKASRYLPRAMLASKMLAKGMELLRYIRKSGVSRYTSAKDFQAVQNDDGQLTFSFRTRKRVHQLVTPLVLSHQGVVSSTHISRSLGLAHEWNLSQQAFLPIVDKWGRTKNSRIHIAGDGAGIGGARAAIASGRIAVLDMLFQLGKLSDDQRNQSSTADRALLRQSLAIRPFLDALYYPPKEILAPSGETLVCRCEEIRASTIRQTLNQSGLGPRQIKSSTRSGMGPCQGRMCELPIQGILSSCGKKHLLPKVRTPIKPISLGELASLAERPSTKS